MQRIASLLSIAAVSVLCAAPAAQAKTFKWASQGEISTWDIHSQNNALQNGIHANVYESLVYYNSRTFQVERYGVARGEPHTGALHAAPGREVP